MEESPKAQGSTPALLWPRGVNHGAQPAHHDRSCNEVMEGQINSFRDQPLAGSTRDTGRGTLQGPSFTAWFWCWGMCWSRGGSIEARTRSEGQGAMGLCHPPLLESWDPRSRAEHRDLLASLCGAVPRGGMGPSQTLSTTHRGVFGER